MKGSQVVTIKSTKAVVNASSQPLAGLPRGDGPTPLSQHNPRDALYLPATKLHVNLPFHHARSTAGQARAP